MKLAVISGATRNGRNTDRQSLWIVKTANQIDGIRAEHIDLKDYPMPFFDEPVSPRFNSERKINPIAKRWLRRLELFDAYIFVTPEYNHSVSGVLKNALDYVTWEIYRKPAAVASHGTVGGARAAMHLKEILSESRAVVIPNASAIVRMNQIIDEHGNINSEIAAQPHGPQSQLNSLLEELKWYSDALAAARLLL